MQKYLYTAAIIFSIGNCMAMKKGKNEINNNDYITRKFEKDTEKIFGYHAKNNSPYPNKSIVSKPNSSDFIQEK